MHSHFPAASHRAAAAYCDRFGTGPRWVARAPGRVNLIGEHTDYNGGFVLPMAIDREVVIAAAPRDDRCVVIESLDFPQLHQFDLDDTGPLQQGWPRYVQAVARALGAAGLRVHGWQGIVASDVPVAAGLSSSAAMELATARVFAAAAKFDWDPVEMAKLAQRAENVWVGVQCGIMDQLVCAAGHANSALLIDCRSLEMRQVGFAPGSAVLVVDSATRRELENSEYNARRGQCETAANLLGVDALRDATLERLDSRLASLGDVLARRARHVITENQRTLAAAQALPHVPATFGRLMRESHASLQRDFEVSRAEVDRLVELLSQQNGCYGARMTGAGFGGCAVALIEASSADSISAAVLDEYRTATGLVAQAYVCLAVDGASVERFEE